MKNLKNKISDKYFLNMSYTASEGITKRWIKIEVLLPRVL